MTDAIRIPERSGDALLLGGSPVQPQADLNWAEQFFTQLGRELGQLEQDFMQQWSTAQQAGLPGGQVVSVNGDGYVAHGADAGASMFREVDGIPQLVSSLRGPFAQQSAVGDIVAVRVFRYDGEQPAGEQWDEPPPADRETW